MNDCVLALSEPGAAQAHGSLGPARRGGGPPRQGRRGLPPHTALPPHPEHGGGHASQRGAGWFSTLLFLSDNEFRKYCGIFGKLG